MPLSASSVGEAAQLRTDAMFGGGGAWRQRRHSEGVTGNVLLGSKHEHQHPDVDFLPGKTAFYLFPPHIFPKTNLSIS